MNCPNCNTPNADGEQFCAACGSELTGVVPNPTPAPAATAQPTPQSTPQTPSPIPSLPAVATLSFDGKDFPLHEGAKFLIARKDTTKCQPDLPIDADDVSSTPIEVSVTNGTVTVRDTGTSIGTRVVKYLNPNESAEVKPGDMIMLGNQLITIS